MADRLVQLGGDQVQLGGVDVILGQEPGPPVEGISPYGFHLWRYDVEITPNSEWNATWREGIGGVNEATVTVQNREALAELDFLTPTAGLSRDMIKMTYGPGDYLTDWVLWEGECVNPALDLPVGFPFRRWKLGCTDWNTVLDLRILGAIPGWAVHPGGDADLESGDPNGPYYSDPNATVGSSDRVTLQNWFEAYVEAPDGGSFDTDEFVGELIPPEILVDPVSGEPHLIPDMGPLKGAIASLAGLAKFPVYDWIDPDRKVHHVAYDGPDGYLGLPRAPFQITDVGTEWDGVTKIGGRGLQITPDRTFGPQMVWVNGVTPLVVLASDDAANLALYGGRYVDQGTGWGHSISATGPLKNLRQMMVEGQAVTRAERDALADTYTAFGQRPRYRGSITVGGRDGEIMVGLRAGQLLTITDARLPDEINGIEWPIQALSGSLVAGSANILRYGIEFGDGSIERFSSKYRQASSAKAKRIAPAPRHAIYFQTLNPKPGEVQTLTSQAMDNADQPLRAAGLAVHWEFVAPSVGVLPITDHLGNDRSGNGESLSPEDTVTSADGTSTTTFTAGSLDDTYYSIEASTPVQAP